MIGTRPDILLVENDDDDADLTVRAFKQARVDNTVIRVRDGVLALDYLLGRGSYARRNVNDVPAVILLHLERPGLPALEAHAAICNDRRIAHLPVVILRSSNDDKDRLAAYKQLANSYIRRPVEHDQFVVASRELGLYWLVFNIPAPPSARRCVGS